MTDQLQGNEAEFMSALLDAMTDSVYVKDTRGRIIAANAPGVERMSLTRDDVVGKTNDQLKVLRPQFAEVFDRCTQTDERVFARKEAVTYYERFPQENGDEHVFEHRKTPVVREGRVTGLLVIVRDVSAEESQKRRLVDAQIAAEAAGLAKSNFLASMSHEIRTPMTAILGYAEAMLESPGLPEACREPVGIVHANARHLLEILNDILDFSRIEAGRMLIKRTVVDPGEFLASVGRLLEANAAEKGIVLRVEAPAPCPPAVSADETRLRQILLNLASNAVKFTAGGEVVISSSYNETTGIWTIDVSDTGPGIDPGLIEGLFEPFERGDSTMSRRIGGTGLGLTISRRLARLLGGDVSLRSTNPGAGSVFRVTMPAPAAELELADRTASDAQTQAPSLPPGLLVLLAEDGRDNQRLIAHFLEKSGVEVVSTSNGREAIGAYESLTSAGRRVDLILMDIQMPELDGHAATRSLREQGCEAPIIALTAHALDSDRSDSIAAGCTAYASKPISRLALLEACASALRGTSGGVR